MAEPDAISFVEALHGRLTIFSIAARAAVNASQHAQWSNRRGSMWAAVRPVRLPSCVFR